MKSAAQIEAERKRDAAQQEWRDAIKAANDAADRRDAAKQRYMDAEYEVSSVLEMELDALRSLAREDDGTPQEV